MINVHLNGDIVRCPDIAAIHSRNQELKDAHRICKYNYQEDNCSTWQSSVKSWMNVKNNGCTGRCLLSGTGICPGHIAQTLKGKQEKSFKIDNQVFRKLASTAHYLVKTSYNKVLFITLTFPKFKKKVSYNEINQLFSKYVENLRKNYACGGYIGVRQLGDKRHRVHFHLLLSIPFVPFADLNNSWCNTIKDVCNYSANALTTDPKTKFITNPGRAMRYVCKYFAKCKGQKSKSRLVFISNNIIQKPVHYTGTIETLLSGYKGIYIQQTSDYSTCFRVTNNKDFQRFCDEFLYNAFNISDVVPGKMYAFPVNTS
jgi:hypothetical protein